MNRRVQFLGLLMLFPGFVLEAHSQQPTQRTKIFFECTCNDPVGALYATAFRDLLATSPRYAEASEAVEKDNSGKVASLNWHFVVVSIDPSSANDGRSTVLSEVFLIGKDIYLFNRVQSFGRSSVQDAAKSTLASLDKEIHEDSK
jgi:hypothetical protein